MGPLLALLLAQFVQPPTALTAQQFTVYPVDYTLTVGTNPPVERSGLMPGCCGLSTIEGAASMLVTTTAPTGETQQTICAATPCEVTVLAGIGEYLFRIEYLAADGGVLAVIETGLTP